MPNGFTVWLTGLPNSGKTTVANLLAEELEKLGYPLEVLDGNELRDRLSPGLGFSRQDRIDHNLRVAFLCRMLNKHGVICLVAVIAPYQELRDQIREEVSDYVEVFLDCPQQVLVDRDTKDLYHRALAGELPNFTGVSDPFDRPARPELTLCSDQLGPKECCQAIMLKLMEMGYLAGGGYTPDEEAAVRRRLEDLGYM